MRRGLGAAAAPPPASAVAAVLLVEGPLLEAFPAYFQDLGFSHIDIKH